MTEPLDQEHEAKADIIARPEVTGEPVHAGKIAAKEPVNAPDAAPDHIDISAGKMISKAVDDLKILFGMESDRDFQLLLSEMLGGIFSGIRVMGNRPWIRFAVAGGAIAFSFLPAIYRHSTAKEAADAGKQDEKQ